MSAKDIERFKFPKGQSGNPAGRPKGSRNRSTIARQWLEIEETKRNPITGKDERMSQEDLITLAQIKKAREGDTLAYKAIMDSAHGSPNQNLHQTIESDNIILTFGIAEEHNNTTARPTEGSDAEA